MGKNYDPRMHTAEHILNGTMVRMFGCGRCFSAHIEKKKSKCDYRFARELATGELKEIEERVNRVIQADLPVSERWLPCKEAEKRYDLHRLPASANDNVRIVDVDTFDSCPCIGPHVRSTGEIGAFQITSADFAKGVVRIRFRLNKAVAVK